MKPSGARAAQHQSLLHFVGQAPWSDEGAGDGARRRKAGVPEDLVFQTKPEIALEQIRAAGAASIAHGVVLLDAGYGNHTRLRTPIGALGLTYAAGILSSTSVWAAGTQPLPPNPGRGQPPTRLGQDGEHKPVPVKKLALSLPARAWRKIDWREGTAERLSSRFARLRVHAAHRGKRYDEDLRKPAGTCIACFRPALVTNVRKGAAYVFRWDGKPEPIVTARV